MKFLNLVLISLVVISSFSTPLPLSERSWKSVGASAFKGAFVGAVIGSTGALFLNILSLYKQQSILNSFRKNVAYGTALVGALGYGICEYLHTPEKQYEYAKKEVVKIEQDSAICVLYNFDRENWVEKLCQSGFNSSYPLASAHCWLNTLYEKLVKIKNSASEALILEDAILRQECEEIIIYADATLALLHEAMRAITAQPTYTTEYAAKMQEEAARAAHHDAAFSEHGEWHNSTLSSRQKQKEYTQRVEAINREADWQMTRSLLSTVQC